MTILGALELQLMAAEKPLSFKSFSPEVQERFQRASDYADMFVELKNSAGVPVAAMAAYYLCLARMAPTRTATQLSLARLGPASTPRIRLPSTNVGIAIFAKRNITRISG